MKLLYFLILNTSFVVCVVSGAVVEDIGGFFEQGLYSTKDNVIVLTSKSFEANVYGQKRPLLIQFYNSYCGHCRAFAPKFKNLASEIEPWQKVIKLAVIDCSIDENNGICRQFEVMAYPTIRYIPENYKKSNANVGDRMQLQETVDKLKESLILKMQSEKSNGRLSFAPPLSIKNYHSYESAVGNPKKNILYTFLVFENSDSTVGSELALDINNYNGVEVVRVYDNSELAETARIRSSPGLVVVKSGLEPTVLDPSAPTKSELLKAINAFLSSNGYVFPNRNKGQNESYNTSPKNPGTGTLATDPDTVYYSDLEKTLKTSLNTEITRYKILTGEPLEALLEYLDVIKVSFPFKNVNLKNFITSLRENLDAQTQWNGNDVYDLVKRLESSYAPVYMTDLNYIGCKGSQEKYRGYSCGLWTLFHTLTVNAVDKPNKEGAKVLKAMLGYVKYFFGCTDCAEHFQAMATKNKIFEARENDKAVLWLWISHNEVNLRIAGDVTEDPQHPKIQFPNLQKCKECRLARGAWNLPAVYEYLLKMYGANNIQLMKRSRSEPTSSSPFSNLDIGLLSLLYILSFIMLTLVIRYLISKHFFRKRRYKHAWGKV